MAPLSSSLVTAHFSRSELRYDAAPVAYRGNLEELAALLERVRAVVGVPLAVTSGYRAPAANAALAGASSTSQHLTGSAADFRPVGISVEEFLRRLSASGFDLAGSQLIVYPLGSDHVHLGLPRPGAGRVLVQVSRVASAPQYLPVTLGDSVAVYREWRAQRGATVLLVLVALVILGALFLHT